MLKDPAARSDAEVEKLLLSPVHQKSSYLCRFTPELKGRAFLDIGEPENHTTTTRSEVSLLLLSGKVLFLSSTVEWPTKEISNFTRSASRIIQLIHESHGFYNIAERSESYRGIFYNIPCNQFCFCFCKVKGSLVPPRLSLPDCALGQEACQNYSTLLAINLGITSPTDPVLLTPRYAA